LSTACWPPLLPTSCRKGPNSAGTFAANGRI
jgi:hypothetical protein